MLFSGCSFKSGVIDLDSSIVNTESSVNDVISAMLELKFSNLVTVCGPAFILVADRCR